MRRSILVTISVLGLLVTLLGGTGLFAALTDTADLGPNDVNAAPMAGSSDLKLAYRIPEPGNPNATICGPYQDDLTTEFFIAALNFGPGSTASNMVCLKNVGSQTVDVVVTAIDLNNVDDGCTGDEASLGDATCGGGALGELSNVLQVVFTGTDCLSGAVISPGVGSILTSLVGGPLGVTPTGLGSGAEVCYDIFVTEPGGLPQLDLQLAQSDSVAWAFRFTGTATP